MKETGLYHKYKVIKRSTGEEVTSGCFVLIPAKDKVARKAIYTYAKETDDEELREDLLAWMGRLDENP